MIYKTLGEPLTQDEIQEDKDDYIKRNWNVIENELYYYFFTPHSKRCHVIDKKSGQNFWMDKRWLRYEIEDQYAVQYQSNLKEMMDQALMNVKEEDEV
jgi:hypothetical protein